MLSSNQRRLASFAVAVTISCATVFFVQHWLHNALASRPAESVADVPVARPTTHVLVAKGELPAGTILKAENLRWQEWPQDAVDDAYLIQDKAKLEDFVGAVVRTRLSSGEPITATRVAHTSDRGFMSAVLSPGMRAVTVNVNASTGMAGLVSPGDHVDLLLTMTVQSGEKDVPARHMSETVLTNLRVLAMDQRVTEETKDLSPPKTATLEVSPKQAELVAVATELGLLSLSLRSLGGDDDSQQHAGNAPTWDSDATHLIRDVSRSLQHSVHVVRGGQATDQMLPDAAKEALAAVAPTASR
jgi:pilus assembly protein CpaB